MKKQTFIFFISALILFILSAYILISSTEKKEAVISSGSIDSIVEKVIAIPNEIHNKAIDKNIQFHKESIDWADELLQMMKELNKGGIFDDRIIEMEQHKQDLKKWQQYDRKKYKY